MIQQHTKQLARAKIRDQAADWLIELEAAREVGGDTEALLRSFKAWLDLTPEHRVAYLRAEWFWNYAKTLYRDIAFTADH
jgi:ferric-dicitrate binding protein FerR (iron transport regulator)